MNVYPYVVLASIIALFFIFFRSRRKILYVAEGNIIVRGIFKKIRLDPYELRSIARTKSAISTVFPTSIVVVETSKEAYRVYTGKITDDKWTAFIEDLK